MSDRGDLQDFVDSCRARIESQVFTFRELAGVIDRIDSDEDRGLEPMLAALEYEYFNNLVIVLDASLSAAGRNDGYPPGRVAAEVAALRRSLIEGEGTLLPDAGAPEPSGSILGLAPGDSIRLTQQAFTRLAGAYLAETERRHGV